MAVTVLTDRDQRRKDIGTILIQVASGGLGAITAFLVFALDKRTPGWFFWALVILAVVLLAASIYFGARGIANLGKPSRGYFNVQTVLLILGWAFVLWSIFSVRVSSKGELEAMSKSLDSLKTEISELRKDIGNEQNRRIEVEGQIRSIQESLNRSATGEQLNRKRKP